MLLETSDYLLGNIPAAIWKIWLACTVFAALFIWARWYSYEGRESRNIVIVPWILLYLVCSFVLLGFGAMAGTFSGKIGG